MKCSFFLPLTLALSLSSYRSEWIVRAMSIDKKHVKELIIDQTPSFTELYNTRRDINGENFRNMLDERIMSLEFDNSDTESFDFADWTLVVTAFAAFAGIFYDVHTREQIDEEESLLDY
jgi:hypothetical protein